VDLFTDRKLMNSLPPTRESEQVDAALFERLEKLWGPLDLAAHDLPLRTRAKARITPRRFGDEAALDIDFVDGAGGIELPAVDLPEGASLALGFELTCPAPVDIALFFQLRGDGTYSRQRKKVLSLPAGRSTVRTCIYVPGVGGHLLIRPDQVKGIFTLHSIEARAAR